MDWSVVFPRFNEILSPDRYVAIIEGDRPFDSPWNETERELIRQYSTNRHYKEIDLIGELVNRNQLRLIGDRWTAPIGFCQTVDDYVESFHSRESMSREHMGDSNVSGFDVALSRILEDYADGEGVLHFQLRSRVVWGRPIA